MIGPVLLAEPWWLLGLVAAVGVPVAAHLLSRRPTRTAIFPAARFLLRAVRVSRLRVRLRDRWVLFLRIVILTLAVLAFAKPRWLPRAQASNPGGVDAVFLLDRSASMGRLWHGTTLFDQAKARVIARLEHLDPARDRALVVMVDARSAAILPQLTAGLSGLIERVGRVELTCERGDLAAAVNVAQGVAEDSARTGRPVIVEWHGDSQATQWPFGSAPAPPGLSRLGADWRIAAVGGATENLAVRHPAVTPSCPIVGQPATFSAEVANHSGRSAATAVTFTGDGPPQVQPVSLPPHGVTQVSFTFTLSRTGPALLSLSLDDQTESLALDDRTGLFIEAAPARSVALVRREVAGVQSAGYYFERALLPDPQDAGRYSGVLLQSWSPQEIVAKLRPLTAGGSGAALVVIVEAGGLDPGALGALKDYLLSGGAVLWVIDSPQAVASLHHFAQLLPGTDLSPLRLPPGAEFLWRQGRTLNIGEGRFDGPILSVFEGPARALLLRQTFTAVPSCTLGPSGEALLTLSDGSPLLAAQWVGDGRLAVLAAAVDPDHSQLVHYPQVFVPLIHQLLRNLSPGPPPSVNPHPGAGATITLPGRWLSQDLRVLTPKPTGEGGNSREPFDSQSDGRTTTVRFISLSQVGPYQVTDAHTGALLGGVYVNLDPAESDLSALPTSAEGAVETQVSSGNAGALSTLRPEPVELWPWMLFAASLALMLEQIWLGWAVSIAHSPVDAPTGQLPGAGVPGVRHV